MGALWTVLIAAATYVAGWATHLFFSDPIVRFYKYREDIQARLALYANLGPATSTQDGTKAESLDAAILDLRNLATSLHSLSVSYPYATMVLQYFGYRPAEGGRALPALSNELRRHDPGRAKFRADVERYLILQPWD